MADLFDEHIHVERPNIPELLDRLRQFGDTAAGEEVLKYYMTFYGKQLFYYVCGLGLGKNEAEDVCEQTFGYLWGRLKINFKPGKGERRYLYTTALNEVRSRWREKKRNPSIGPIGNIDIPDKREGVDSLEDKEELELAISKLPKNQRQVIGLRLKGLTLKEISREMRVKSLGTVINWLRKAIKNLQRQLNKELEGEIS